MRVMKSSAQFEDHFLPAVVISGCCWGQRGRDNGKTKAAGVGGLQLRAWNQRWLLSCSADLEVCGCNEFFAGIEEASLYHFVLSCSATQGSLDDSTDGWLYFFPPTVLLFFFLMKFIACVIGFYTALAGFHNLHPVHCGDKSASRKSFGAIIA